MLKRKKLVTAVIVVLVLGGIGLAYYAMRSSAMYYLTPSELSARGADMYDTPLRLAGTVVDGSIVWDQIRQKLTFVITDGTKEYPVVYNDLPPDTFRPGTTAVVEGQLGKDGTFVASQLLVKCASRYEAEIPGT